MTAAHEWCHQVVTCVSVIDIALTGMIHIVNLQISARL